MKSRRFLAPVALSSSSWLALALLPSAARAQTPPMPAKPVPAAAAVNPAAPVVVGPWTARFRNGGLYLDAGRVPLVRGGNVQLFSADYKRGYYGSGENPPTPTMESLADGGRAYTTEYRYAADGNTLLATQRVEVSASNIVRFSITARWDGKELALLEWNPARLWAYALLGTTWQAQPVPPPLIPVLPAAPAVPPVPPTPGTAPVPPPAPATPANPPVPPAPAMPSPASAPRSLPPEPLSGRIGLRPPPADYPANRVGPRFRQIVLHTPALGDLTIAFDGDEGATLFDARQDPFLKTEKRFWLGSLGLPLQPGQPVTRTFTLTLEGDKKGVKGNEGGIKQTGNATNTGRHGDLPQLPNAAAIQNPKSKIENMNEAQRPPVPLTDSTGHPLIIPQPKQIAFTGSDYALRGRVLVYADFNGHDRDGRVAAELARTLADCKRATGINFALTDKPDLTAVRVSVSGDNPAERFARAPENIAPQSGNGRPEGYALHVTPQNVTLTGNDPAGAFYGLQTLRGLLTHRADGTWAFAGADIADWPSLPFRGAHIFVGKNALPFHKKLVERIFSRLKMNAMVIECEYTNWKTHPEIRVPFGMEPDDLRADVAFAREHFMEPIPLVNSLGHSEWIFKNEQHRDLAEDVNSPHAYDASNPDTYRFLFDILGETLSIFQPRWFHIGHDEVKVPSYDGFGKYPARPANIAKGATALFVDDTNKIADWLTARNVRPVMWADMPLHRSEGDPAIKLEMTAANAPTIEEAQKLRAAMPRRAVIADWRYEPGSEQRNGLSIFRQAGFDTLACAWFQPENIRGWASQAVQNGSMGTLQTTWAGYDSNERTLDSELKQFTAFVLAAEYAWNGGAPVTYDAGEVFARAYRDAPPASAPVPGWFLDLHDAANVTLRDQGDDALPFAAPNSNQPALNIQHSALSTQHFPSVGDVGLQLTGTEPGGVMLSGVLNPTALPNPAGATANAAYPQAVAFAVNRQARSLAFLHATGYGDAPGTVVGSYVVVYTDGKRVSIPLRYGHEIFALDDAAPNAMLSTSALIWQTEAGRKTTGNTGKEGETRRGGEGEKQNAPNPEPANDAENSSFSTHHSSLTLRVLRWTNPRPDVPIAHIEFRAASAYAAPILFALTGAQ